jgi:hypothetical protein
MHCAASVAGPRAFEGDLQCRSDADDVGLALGEEGRDDLEALDQKALIGGPCHASESLDEFRTTVGVDGVIACVCTEGNGVGFAGDCHGDSDVEHDGVAVGYDGDPHRHVGVGERRTSQ